MSDKIKSKKGKGMNMYMYSLIVLCVFMYACASANATEMVLASGEHAIAIECAGHSQNACLIEAGAECPNGYDIQENDGHFTRQSNVVVNPSFAIAENKEVHSGSMIIQCHGLSRTQMEAIREAKEKAEEKAQ